MNEMLNKEFADYQKFKDIMDLFQQETIFDAIDILDGMVNAIDSFLKEEISKRSLDTLKTDFLE